MLVLVDVECLLILVCVLWVPCVGEGDYNSYRSKRIRTLDKYRTVLALTCNLLLGTLQAQISNSLQEDTACRPHMGPWQRLLPSLNLLPTSDTCRPRTASSPDSWLRPPPLSLKSRIHDICRLRMHALPMDWDWNWDWDWE
ncbi:hypothetical protein DENSPDRAFT_679854 [Dentipellis sp. KUC8613]|nr:hypothetical protein DENSPDRAFT_679854 [Dentipellis sp. KUC8613]